jgi:acetoin utilization deacetylase AcuC-like enzyme
VAWVSHPDLRRHATEDVHPDRPERLTVMWDALERAGLAQRLATLSFSYATHLDIALAHDPAYVDLVRLVCADGFTFVGTRDTQICPDSYGVALLATGGVLAACDAVMAGKLDRAFCAVRPPGHHAEYDRAMGFCLFNHVAIAAEHLVQRHGLSRVAIVDIDAHHGNGTQHRFEQRADVLYISIHERSGTLPFPGSGEETETGIGEGRGCTLNIPLVAGSGDAVYRRAFRDQVRPALDRYQPEFLLVSTGFDACTGEWVAHLGLEPPSYHWITTELTAAANAHAEGRLVSILEGGYDLTALGACAIAHVRGLLGDPPPHVSINR